jgi:hypothetical protein
MWLTRPNRAASGPVFAIFPCFINAIACHNKNARSVKDLSRHYMKRTQTDAGKGAKKA